jgi:hypothetical protein
MIATKAYHQPYDIDYYGGGGGHDESLGYDTMISRVGAGS